MLGSTCKVPTFLSDFNHISILSTNFHKTLQHQILLKSAPWKAGWHMQTDRRMEGRKNMTKQVGAFRNYIPTSLKFSHNRDNQNCEDDSRTNWDRWYLENCLYYTIWLLLYKWKEVTYVLSQYWQIIKNLSNMCFKNTRLKKKILLTYKTIKQA